MAENHVLIDDILKNQSERMMNLKKFYPFFALYETSFSQYKEGKYQSLDMGYLTLSLLRFFINENNFNENDVTYEMVEKFLRQILRRDFGLEESETEETELIRYIFDKIRNDGRPFTFSFFDPEEKKMKTSYVKLIESAIRDENVVYHITGDGIEFFLSTKEVKDESPLTTEQLLLEKMIRSENFRGGIDVIRRMNIEVTRLKKKRDEVIKILLRDIYEGTKAAKDYMDSTSLWFEEERKSFAKNKALVDKAVGRMAAGHDSKGMRDITILETELKKTIESHSELIAATAELSRITDELVERSKLKQLRTVFDFNNALSVMEKNDRPEDMAHIFMPFLMPKIEKSFSAFLVDNIVTSKSEDNLKGEVRENEPVDLNFEYEDEKFSKVVGKNLGLLFKELLDRLLRWEKVTLSELNAILEIKFGKEIYENRDYYSFLVHLAKKDSYSMKIMKDETETFLEKMAWETLSDADKELYKDISFNIEYMPDEIVIGDRENESEEDEASKEEKMLIRNMAFHRC
ncbi:MAG: hypothetical protein IIY49_08800 [Eubacterium sp.]|nr:hypothetical protein [Eubacterium sp.]